MKLLIFVLAVWVFAACAEKVEKEPEQLQAGSGSATTDTTGLQAGTDKDLNTKPSNVLNTSWPQHRLLTVYQIRYGTTKTDAGKIRRYVSSSFDYNNTADTPVEEQHYMPGLDLLRGYELLNVFHIDMPTGKTQPFFERNVLIKSLYYPSFEPDSIGKQPIVRDYYLCSAYESDTDGDKFINRHDLRRFFAISLDGATKTSLLPTDCSATRSQYDPGNDALFIYAQRDTSKNGRIEIQEPLQVFSVDLKRPFAARLLY